MANLKVFDPFDSDTFESAFRRFFAPARFGFESAPDLSAIRVDVDEDSAAYTVRADLPGVAKEDITVQVQGNAVRIDAEVRKEKKVEEKGRTLRSERYVGTLSRAFSFASELDDAKTEAKYENGVLTLRIPKKETASGSKRIAIR